MKFGFALSALSVFVLSSAQKCKPTEEQLINQHSPEYIVNRNYRYETSFTYRDRTIYLRERNLTDVTYSGFYDEDIIMPEIKAINDFKNIEENKTTSENYFVYHLERPGFLIGKVHEKMTFYDDGFVTVDDYCYQFDQQKAASLFETVTSIYQADIEKEEELDAISEEYGTLLDNFTIEEAISALEAQESAMKLKLFYYESRPSLRFRRFAFEDKNNEFLNLFKTTTFNTCDSRMYVYYNHDEDTRLEIEFKVDEKDNWALTFNESRDIIHLYRAKYDKYGRYFGTNKFYEIDKTLFKTIMDKAFEIKDAQNANNEED